MDIQKNILVCKTNLQIIIMQIELKLAKYIKESNRILNISL
jgi:hypothetical protein